MGSKRRDEISYCDEKYDDEKKEEEEDNNKKKEREVGHDYVPKCHDNTISFRTTNFFLIIIIISIQQPLSPALSPLLHSKVYASRRKSPAGHSTQISKNFVSSIEKENTRNIFVFSSRKEKKRDRYLCIRYLS